VTFQAVYAYFYIVEKNSWKLSDAKGCFCR